MARSGSLFAMNAGVGRIAKAIMNRPISIPASKAGRLCHGFGASIFSITFRTKGKPSPWNTPGNAVVATVMRCPVDAGATA